MRSRPSLCRLFILGLLVLPAEAPAAVSFSYVYEGRLDFSELPGVLAGQDLDRLHFSRAPTAMQAAALGEHGGPMIDWPVDGKTRALDLRLMPFWVLTEYRAAGCTYDVIDGYWPGEVGRLNRAGAVMLNPFGGAAVRRCGQGAYERVGLLGRDGSIFDSQLGPPRLSPPVTSTVQDGLARDYLARMIKAAGGGAAFQKRLDAAHSDPDPIFRRALAAAGMKFGAPSAKATN